MTHVRLPAHREGVDARHAAARPRRWCTRARPEDVGSARATTISPRASSAISSCARPPFFTNELYLRRGDQLIKIDKPDDAEAAPFRDWLLIRCAPTGRSARRPGRRARCWRRASTISWPASESSRCCSGRGERRSLAGYAVLRTGVVLNELDNVKSRVSVTRERAGAGPRSPVAGLPEIRHASMWTPWTPYTTDALLDRDHRLPHADHAAARRRRQRARAAQALAARSSTAARDQVSQHEAISKDGTRIPYFQVAPSDLKLDGSAPDAAVRLRRLRGARAAGRTAACAARRGSRRAACYVVANIRGGGEFGPRWHQAALKANRPRAYEDFIAVAEDLVQPQGHLAAGTSAAWAARTAACWWATC